jgi:formylglycine-generating enzyme required for sulfatase activity
MVFIDQCGGFCIDAYEASRDEDGFAVSRTGAQPWIEINWTEAKEACEAVGKRLCKDFEWMAACNLDGDRYNLTSEEDHEKFSCNTFGKCGDVPCDTGNNPNCTSDKGVQDMVGNVWEWTDATVPDDSWMGMSGTVGSLLGDESDTYGGDWIYRIPITERDGPESSTMKGNAFMRGGSWTDFSGHSQVRGCFTLDLHANPSSRTDRDGFRCCTD